MLSLLHKKLNYTKAQAQSKNMTSVLADVMSEQRPDMLANSEANFKAAFVALWSFNESSFSTNCEN